MSGLLDLSGQSIGRYTIREKLGQGGMATVYRAFDTRLECDVAVKVIRRDAFASEVFTHVQQRFEREAKALAHLTHPNIVKVTDFGEFESNPYLVMPFVPGGTLKEHCGTPMDYRESAHILLPIARALEYAHRRGVLHRDVKPANILITETGEPLLCDFGIAKLLDNNEGRTLTGTGVGIGTPEYMAPEQGMGNKVDGRVDVYALAVVLYELVAGRKPYTADTPMAVVLKHVTDPLPPPHLFVPSLPDEVERVLFKALAKNPDDRYTDMGAFIVALERLDRQNAAQATEEKKDAGPESSSEATQRTVEISQAEYRTGLDKDGPRLPRLETIEQASTDAHRLQKAAKEGSRKRRRAACVWGAVLVVLLSAAFVWYFGDGVLGWLMPSPTPAPLAAVVSKDRTETPAEAGPTAAPTESSTATALNEFTPAVVLPKKAKIFKMLSSWGVEQVKELKYSPDGKIVAVATSHGVSLYQAKNFALIRRMGEDAWVYSVDFSPDGSLLVTGSDNKKVEIWRVSDGSLVRSMEGHSNDVLSVDFSSDGALVASASADKTVRVWKAADGQQLNVMREDNDYVWTVTFSPDGKRLASGSIDSILHVWRLDGSLEYTLSGTRSGISSLAFPPDGALLASGSADKSVHLWKMKDGSLLQTLLGHTGPVRCVAFSPDGTLLATGAEDNTVRLWNPANGSLVQSLAGHNGIVTSLSFVLPDGLALASGSEDGTVRLWGAP